MDFRSKWICSSTATAMAKRPRNIEANDMEDLVSDSQVQFASDESHYDFSEDSDGTVEADEELRERRSEDKATVHRFTGPHPGLIRVVAPDFNGNPSSFDFFRLMFTQEVFRTILTETKRCYQRHTQKEENRKLQTYITVDEIHRFIKKR
jgi:hypothetical protein